MVSSRKAVLTILAIDQENQEDNWGNYDRNTVAIADKDSKKGTSQAQNDNILVSDTGWNTDHPTLDLDIVDGSSVVRINMRSTKKDRIDTLRDKVENILNTNKKNISSPWHYLEFENRLIDRTRGINYQYIMEVRLYIVDEDLSL